MHRTLGFLAAASILLLLPRGAAAMPDGISGYSGLAPDKTCATCHPGGNPPVASRAGPTMLAPGGTGEYTFTLKTDRTFGGLDVAVDNPAARLMPMSPMTQLLGGEITHSQPLPVQNGEIVVKLELTAPSTPGMVTLHADGQADKMPQIADSSAAAIDFVVTVGGGGGANTGSGTGGNAAGGAGPGGSMPAPMHGCAFGGSETASSIGPAWLLALLATALRRRARS